MKSLKLLLVLVGLVVVTSSAYSDAQCNPPYRIKIGMVRNQLQGQYASVDVVLERVDTLKGLTAFNLVISYDPAVLTFMRGIPGAVVTECGWDTITFEQAGVGLVRITASAFEGGSGTTCVDRPFGVDTLPASLCSLRFLVTNDLSLNGHFSSIDWYWRYCGDNRLTTLNMMEIVESDVVLDADTSRVWNITDSTAGFPTGKGALLDGCLTIPELFLWRGIEFENGGVQLNHSDQLGSRGDLNFNGLQYEEADYITYSNYFVTGESAFNGHVSQSIERSDITADGREVHVSDLVYLGRVLEGDAVPFFDDAPIQTWDSDSQTEFVLTGDYVSVVTEDSLGAVWFMVNREVIPDLSLSSGFDLAWYYDGTNTRILLYDADHDQTAPIGSGPLLTLHPVSAADDDFEIVDLQASDRLGAFVEAGLTFATDVGETPEQNLPLTFELLQNRPNPFNPETHIEFVLPVAASPVFEVFDITGRLVKRINLGLQGPGLHQVIWRADDNAENEVASGIYVYRITAGEYSATKKAVLLK